MMLSELNNKKIYLTLDSYYRNSGNTSSPIFSLNETIDGIRSVTIDRAEIYYNWFLFNTGNNILGSDINGGSVTITAGTYTPTTLATALQVAIRATGGGFSSATVVFSSITSKYTISSGSVSTFTISASGNLAQILGFSSNKSAVTTTTSDFAAYEQNIVLVADNRTFRITQSAITTDFTIPAGNYSGTTLASQIQTLLNATLSNFSVLFNTYNNTLTFSHTTTAFTISGSVGASAILGFTSDVVSTSLSASSLQAINITGNTSVIIKSNAIASKMIFPSIQNTIYTNKILEFPLTGSQNSVIFYEPEQTHIISFYDKGGISLSSIDLRLIDDTGKLISFDTNGRWKMYITLELC